VRIARADRRIAVALYGGFWALVGAAALAVAVGVAPRARDFLDFGFGGPPGRLSAAARIFATNLHLVGALLAACLVVQSPRIANPAAPSEQALRALRGICDAVLLFAFGANAVFVGAALGAYGGRMVAALLPHGPLEIAAYIPAGLVYTSARRQGLDRRAIRPVGLSVAALGVAAMVETYLG
jgi:hypothetical protein